MSTLLVAATGGHLAQLYRLRPRLRGVESDAIWVTFDTPQSRSLLADEDVRYAEYTAPRDYANVVRNLRMASSILRTEDIRATVSTGSGIALSFLPLARAHRLPCHYIESAARSDGPSFTGRVLRRTPGVRLYTQYRAWAGGPWRYVGSVFDGYAVVDAEVRSGASPLRTVVMLGTIPYPFERLLGRMREVLPPEADVLWQTGVSTAGELGGEIRPSLPARELDAALREADVVVCHAGIGSALAALDAGHCPILVPREQRHGEHIDDHQEQIARDLASRGLALHRRVDELTVDDLAEAASRRVVAEAGAPAIELHG